MGKEADHMENKLDERGSARIFELPQHDHLGFAKALMRARADYEVKWWWKYGQPRIDSIRAVIEVKADGLGDVVTDVMKLNKEGVQATLEAFPYGQPKPEAFRLDVKITRGL
jgi:hypothetical protein